MQDAVELGVQFKDEGRYNWFRGQVKDWPPHSTAVRLLRRGDAEEIQRVEERWTMFLRWLTHCPELSRWADLSQKCNVHAVEAIMQHYGIPTHYIDFSTEPAVAGFFAADTQTLEYGTMSCIYCLNTEDLKSWCSSVASVKG